VEADGKSGSASVSTPRCIDSERRTKCAENPVSNSREVIKPPNASDEPDVSDITPVAAPPEAPPVAVSQRVPTEKQSAISLESPQYGPLPEVPVPALRRSAPASVPHQPRPQHGLPIQQVQAGVDLTPALPQVSEADVSRLREFKKGIDETWSGLDGPTPDDKKLVDAWVDGLTRSLEQAFSGDGLTQAEKNAVYRFLDNCKENLKSNWTRNWGTKWMMGDHSASIFTARIKDLDSLVADVNNLIKTRKAPGAPAKENDDKLINNFNHAWNLLTRWGLIYKLSSGLTVNERQAEKQQ
jgi:hypothetical protein